MYTELIRKQPRPTTEQTDNFIFMVANDHSWYKHLSMKRKEYFVFYLDPNAGKTLKKITENENPYLESYFEFKNNNPRYQKDYGCWNYYTTHYTVNLIPNGDGSIKDSRPYIGLNIVNSSGRLVPIPEEIISKGSIKLSCFLHMELCIGNKEFVAGEEPGITYEQKHEEIIKDLGIHLNSFLDYVYQ